MKCPKCNHERKSDHHNPDWQCPSCGIAYNKFNNKTDAESQSQNEESLKGILFYDLSDKKSSGSRKGSIASIIVGIGLGIVGYISTHDGVVRVGDGMDARSVTASSSPIDFYSEVILYIFISIVPIIFGIVGLYKNYRVINKK